MKASQHEGHKTFTDHEKDIESRSKKEVNIKVA